MSRLLLDTSVVLRLLLGERHAISKRAVAALEDSANELVVSAASCWEIAIKRSLRKLAIEDRWARTLTRMPFDPLPVTAIHAAAVETLPFHHRDPFDRLLIAQASSERLAVVTSDPRFGAYDVGVVW